MCFRISWCRPRKHIYTSHQDVASLSQVKKKAAEKPKEYAELQAKYAKMQEMDMARYATGSSTTPAG